jgi:hypothetical protein
MPTVCIEMDVQIAHSLSCKPGPAGLNIAKVVLHTIRGRFVCAQALLTRNGPDKDHSATTWEAEKSRSPIITSVRMRGKLQEVGCWFPLAARPDADLCLDVYSRSPHPDAGNRISLPLGLRQRQMKTGSGNTPIFWTMIPTEICQPALGGEVCSLGRTFCSLSNLETREYAQSSGAIAHPASRDSVRFVTEKLIRACMARGDLDMCAQFITGGLLHSRRGIRLHSVAVHARMSSPLLRWLPDLTDPGASTHLIFEPIVLWSIPKRVVLTRSAKQSRRFYIR